MVVGARVMVEVVKNTLLRDEMIHSQIGYKGERKKNQRWVLNAWPKQPEDRVIIY